MKNALRDLKLFLAGVGAILTVLGTAGTYLNTLGASGRGWALLLAVLGAVQLITAGVLQSLEKLGGIDRDTPVVRDLRVALTVIGGLLTGLGASTTYLGTLGVDGRPLEVATAALGIVHMIAAAVLQSIDESHDPPPAREL